MAFFLALHGPAAFAYLTQASYNEHKRISFLSLSGYTDYFPPFLHVCVHRNVFLRTQTQSWMLSFYPAWKMYLIYFYSNFYFSGF